MLEVPTLESSKKYEMEFTLELDEVRERCCFLSAIAETWEQWCP